VEGTRAGEVKCAAGGVQGRRVETQGTEQGRLRCAVGGQGSRAGGLRAGIACLRPGVTRQCLCSGVTRQWTKAGGFEVKRMERMRAGGLRCRDPEQGVFEVQGIRAAELDVCCA
jgi:hypothetical protein